MKNIPPPWFFPLLKPGTPASLKSNFYAPSILLPPPSPDSQTLLLGHEPGERPACLRDGQGHGIGKDPGLLRAQGAQPGSAARARVRPGRPRLGGREAAGAGAAAGTAASGAGPQRPRETGPQGRHSPSAILSPSPARGELCGAATEVSTKAEPLTRRPACCLRLAVHRLDSVSTLCSQTGDWTFLCRPPRCWDSSFYSFMGA